MYRNVISDVFATETATSNMAVQYDVVCSIIVQRSVVAYHME